VDWFATQLLAWHKQHGRKDLPWQQDINPYRVWISEIMLQQTQVATVIDYYLRFMDRFPNIAILAKAPLDDVLHHWTGLGYYARARNLHRSANLIQNEHAGNFPQSQDELEALPGIGRSTAGAIRAISMRQPAAILDGNVKRVLTRFHALPGYPGTTENTKTLWTHAEAHTPEQQTHTYTQAIMDLGATLCTRKNPKCDNCPAQNKCQAYADNTVDQYPASKPKKAKPTRAARFFVITQPNGMTLLERRPMEGLWGGLWTPLERPSDKTAEQVCDDLGIGTPQLIRQHQAPTFRHTFTHFHLDVEPIYLHLTAAPHLVEENDTHRWVKYDDLNGSNNPIGLSAVAVKLLAALEETIL
jgi:A/G-specific adenine glycosylase